MWAARLAGRVKMFAAEEFAQGFLEVVLVAFEGLAKLHDHLADVVAGWGFRNIVDERAVDLPSDEFRTRLVRQQHVHEVVPIPSATSSQDAFETVVVLVFIEEKVVVPIGVSRECSGAFLDVALAVRRTLASQQFRFSQTEEFHDLPGQIFVGGTFAVSVVVEEATSPGLR